MRITKESIDRFFDYDFHIDSRTVYIGGEIDSVTAERVIKGLHILKMKESEGDITVLLNSEGGNWYDGLAIYDMIKSLDKNHVTIEVLGHAFSMASVILQAGDERIIHPNASIMVHDGQDGFDGKPKDNEAWAKHGRMERDRMYKIFASRTKYQTPKHWEKLCSHDTIFTADRALEIGLVDGIWKAEE